MGLNYAVSTAPPYPNRPNIDPTDRGPTQPDHNSTRRRPDPTRFDPTPTRPTKVRPNPTTTRHGDDPTQPNSTQHRPDDDHHPVGVGSNWVGSGRRRVELWSGWVGPLSVGSVLGRIGLGRVVSASSCGRVGSGLCRSGRCWVESGWVGSSPRRVVVGLGRASVGRVGVGSNRVGSGRLRVELWSGWVGPLSVGSVLGPQLDTCRV